MVICHTKKGTALSTESKEDKADRKQQEKDIWAKQHGRVYEWGKEWLWSIYS